MGLTFPRRARCSGGFPSFQSLARRHSLGYSQSAAMTSPRRLYTTTYACSRPSKSRYSPRQDERLDSFAAVQLERSNRAEDDMGTAVEGLYREQLHMQTYPHTGKWLSAKLLPAARRWTFCMSPSAQSLDWRRARDLTL